MSDHNTASNTYTDSVNEQVRVKVDATGGTFTLTFGGQTTSAQAFNVAAEDLEADLEALSSIPDGAVSVTGGPGNAGGSTPYVVTFIGDLAGTNVGAITANAASLTGGAAAVTITVLATGSDGHVLRSHQTTVITDPDDAHAVQTEGGVGPKNRLDVHDSLSPAEARAAY